MPVIPLLKLDLITTKLFFDAVRSPGGVGHGFIAEFSCENFEDENLFPNPCTVQFILHESRRPAKFIINSNNKYSVITSAVALEAFENKYDVFPSIKKLPQLLIQLMNYLKDNSINIQSLQAIQFPINLSPTINGYKVRSHVVNLCIYRDSSDNNIKILFIDSTMNPFALADYMFLGFFENVKTEINKLLHNYTFREVLRELFTTGVESLIQSLGYVYTGLQSCLPWPFVTPDKRCALYAMNLEAWILKIILSTNPEQKAEIDADIIYQLALRAHREVNLLPDLNAKDLGIDIPLIYNDPSSNIFRAKRLTESQVLSDGYVQPMITNAKDIKNELARRGITLEMVKAASEFELVSRETTPSVVLDENIDLPALRSLIVSMYNTGQEVLSKQTEPLAALYMSGFKNKK